MEFQVTVHALILFLTFVLAVGVAFLISWKITTSGSVTLVFMMVSIAVYALGASLEAAAQGIPLKIIFAKIQYAGFSSSVTLLLMFALQYTRHDDWLRKGRWMLLWLVPVLITLTAWTNEQHQFLWNGFNFDESRNILLYGHGAGVLHNSCCNLSPGRRRNTSPHHPVQNSCTDSTPTAGHHDIRCSDPCFWKCCVRIRTGDCARPGSHTDKHVLHAGPDHLFNFQGSASEFDPVSRHV